MVRTVAAGITLFVIGILSVPVLDYDITVCVFLFGLGICAILSKKEVKMDEIEDFDNGIDCDVDAFDWDVCECGRR